MILFLKVPAPVLKKIWLQTRIDAMFTGKNRNFQISFNFFKRLKTLDKVD